MARKPNLTTPVAVVRTALGLTAGEFAELVGCGKSTIQHIETGDRPLKAELGDAIHFATGVPRDWLERQSLSIDEVRGWRSRGVNLGQASAFAPRTIEEHRTSGGPVYFGKGIFLADEIVPRIAAVFYELGRHNLNPHLAVLAVRRALADVISRFALPVEKVDAMEKEMHSFYFPSAIALKAQLQSEKNSPGYKALVKYADAVRDRLVSAERSRGRDGFIEARQELAAQAVDVVARKRRKRR